MTPTTNLRHGQRFGNWVFNAKQLTLDLYEGNEIHGYYVDLEEISNPAEMLDWIFQVRTKPDGRKNVADLVEALEIIFQPQTNLCPFGKAKTINKVSEFLRERAGQPIQS